MKNLDKRIITLFLILVLFLFTISACSRQPSGQFIWPFNKVVATAPNPSSEVQPIQKICTPGTLKQGTQCLVCSLSGASYASDNSKCSPGKICNAYGRCLTDYVLEVSKNVDLSSDSKLPGFENVQTVHIKSSSSNGITLPKKYFNNVSKDVFTDDAWFTNYRYGSPSPLYVFYKDHDNSNKRNYAGNFTQTGPYYDQGSYDKHPEIPFIANGKFSGNFSYNFSDITFKVQDNTNHNFWRTISAYYTTQDSSRGMNYKLGSYPYPYPIHPDYLDPAEIRGYIEGFGEYHGLTNKDIITPNITIRNPKLFAQYNQVRFSLEDFQR